MALTGQLDASLLVAVQGPLRLTVRTAAAWRGLADEVQRRYGWRPSLTDAYRDYAAQVRIFTARYRRQASGVGPFGDVRCWDGRRYVRYRGAAAAIPGTSNHGRGDTVDVGDLGKFGSRRFVEFATVATRWGWSNAEGRSVGEPWHWVRVADITPTPTASTATDVPLEDTMRMIRRGRSGTTVLVDAGVATPLTDAQRDAWVAAGVPLVSLADAVFDTAVASLRRAPLWWDVTVARGDQDVPVIQEVANAATLAAEAVALLKSGGKVGAGVDVDALAAALGEALTAQLTAAVRAGMNGARITTTP